MPLLQISHNSDEVKNFIYCMTAMMNYFQSNDDEGLKKLVQTPRFDRALHTWRDIHPQSFNEFHAKVAKIRYDKMIDYGQSEEI